MMNILQRLMVLEQGNMQLWESNTELQESNTKLQESNTKLQESNMELQESNTELQGCNTELQERLIDLCTELREGHDRLEVTMQTMMEAVLGVCDIFNIYISFLSDFICRIALQSTRYETEFFLT
jgi:predicted nuclease with TOPRIM domain